MYFDDVKDLFLEFFCFLVITTVIVTAILLPFLVIGKDPEKREKEPCICQSTVVCDCQKYCNHAEKRAQWECPHPQPLCQSQKEKSYRLRPQKKTPNVTLLQSQTLSMARSSALI